jgi:branched-chain amino acid transport system permease protein
VLAPGHRVSDRPEAAVGRRPLVYLRMGLAVALVAAAPLILHTLGFLGLVREAFWLTVLCQIGIAVIGAVGLNLLTGASGQISLGQGGFLAVGAYTSALLVTRFGVPWPVSMVGAILLTSAVGTFFGLPSLRLSGLYLAIATVASQAIILYLVKNWDAVTHGVGSVVVPRPWLLAIRLDNDLAWYWVIASVAALAVVTATNLMRTGIGRAWIAVRDQEVAAAAVGVRVGAYKLLAFAVSSAYVGLAGALTAQYTGIVTWERFTFDVSVLYLAMIIIGGLGSVSGSVYGATFMIALPAWIQQLGQSVEDTFPVITAKLPAVQLGVFGLVIVVFLIFEPRGLARTWQRINVSFRPWPFRA